ncbi:MAG: hypothetical protein LBU42_09630 [Prevotellaceae bacterium]|jgi:hypothetical protein|nr:hypothetical protein [Prevotellaceae bacterium]
MERTFQTFEKYGKNFLYFGASIKFIIFVLQSITIQIMGQLQGIKYTKDACGYNRYVHIDLQQHGGNELLEDFLDRIDIEARKEEPTVPFEEVLARENKRRGLE